MREQFGKALSTPLLSVVDSSQIKMNSEHITIVYCVGSGQGDLGFALDVPRNQTARWLKKIIRDTIRPDVPPENISLYYEVRRGPSTPMIDVDSA